MANLKRNMIELVTGVEGDEVVTEKYWTPPFIPMSVVYEAISLLDEKDDTERSEVETLDILLNFVAETIYKGAFSKKDLEDGLHAPDAVNVLQEQVMFIAQGQQTEATKNFLAKKN